MRKWLNLYFDLSKKEFNGLLVMIGLIGIITAVPFIYGMLSNEPDVTSSDLLMIEKLKSQLRSEESAIRKRFPGIKRYYGHTKKYKTELFVFDPNVISGADWQRLGLSEKQAAAILRYRSKGGRFRNKEDLRKMYTISPDMYERVESYIRIIPIPEQVVWPKNAGSIRSAAGEKKRIEINGADSAELCEIKGIGPAFAARIIKYRQRLGGFCRTTQLMEVYGLDSLKYAEIDQQITVDAGRIKPIYINTAEFADLKYHPYLRYKQMNALIQYRKQHGNYSNIADLSKVLVLDAETIIRIAPYLVFQ